MTAYKSQRIRFQHHTLHLTQKGSKLLDVLSALSDSTSVTN